MTKTLLPIVMLLFCGLGATAQTAQDTTPSNAVLQSCLLGTDDATWMKLKLTPDQMKRTLMVQEACKEECEAAGGKMPADSPSHSSGSVVLSELSSILTPEQYKTWVAYCAGSGGAVTPK